MDWHTEAFEHFRGFAAPRVLASSDIAAAVAEVRKSVSATSVRGFTNVAEASGAFVKVRRGLWLNALAVPSPTYAEAASWIRRGAVVSLHSVLGDAGVLNNYTGQVFSVLPIPAAGPQPDTSPLDVGETVYQFKSMKEEVLTTGDPRDRLNPLVAYPRATAEAALVHWMYLAHVQGSTMKEPDTQCDVSLLDMERLRRLASAVRLEDEVMSWVERCRQREHDDDEQIGWGPGA